MKQKCPEERSDVGQVIDTDIYLCYRCYNKVPSNTYILAKEMLTVQQSGFFWHVHPGILLEWCYSYDERAWHIRTDKPPSEQELRSRLLQPVKGQLPQGLVEAREAYVEAREAHNEAWKAHDEAEQAYLEAWKAHGGAREAYREANKIFVKVWRYCIKWGKARNKLRDYYNEVEKYYRGAREAYDGAWDVCVETRKVYDGAEKAYAKALVTHKDEIEALHSQECPDCPWNGETIFPAA